MSNYATLKAAIQSAVYTNGNNEITGAGLQAVLLQIVNTVGGGYTFAGIATTGTSPGTPDENVFYIAPAGTYTNFGTGYTVPDGYVGVFLYNGNWTKSVLRVTASKECFHVELNATSTKAFYALPDYFANKKVYMYLNCASYSGVTCNANTGVTFISIIYPYMWTCIQFTSEPVIYYGSTSPQVLTIDAVVSPTAVELLEEVPVVREIGSGDYGTFTSGELICNDGEHIIAKQGVVPQFAYPNTQNLYQGIPMSDLSLFSDGKYFQHFYQSRLVRLLHEGWFGDILAGYSALFPVNGYIDTDGIAKAGGAGNVLTEFIPVCKGMRVHYHGAYNTTYDMAWLYKSTSNTADSVVGALFDNDTSYEDDHIVTITDDEARYVRAWGSVVQPTLRILPPRTSAYDIVVAADGSGDLTDLYSAIRAAKHMSGHTSVYVKAGEYEMPVVTSPYYQIAQLQDISIIGESKESVTIYNNDGIYVTGDNHTDSTPLRLAGNVTIRDVTIKSMSTEYSGADNPASYCIHVDFNVQANAVMVIENCTMYNDHYACVGVGLREGFTLKIHDCEMYSRSNAAFEHDTWNGAIICHDGNVAGSAQRIEIVNNQIKCTGDHAVSLMPAYGNQIDALFIGNAIFSAGTEIYKGSPVTIDNKSCLNNIVIS